MWDEPNIMLKCQNDRSKNPKKVLIHFDSWNVVMEVEIV